MGALPPYLPTHCYILISYTQHLPSLPQANVSAPRFVSNCPITFGSLSGSMYSLTTIYFFIPCLFKSYSTKWLGVQTSTTHSYPTLLHWLWFILRMSSACSSVIGSLSNFISFLILASLFVPIYTKSLLSWEFQLSVR